jgi:hypothetical protein
MIAPYFGVVLLVVILVLLLLLLGLSLIAAHHISD